VALLSGKSHYNAITAAVARVEENRFSKDDDVGKRAAVGLT